jgi:molecular chaperone GrpE (heat shock protein)
MTTKSKYAFALLAGLLLPAVTPSAATFAQTETPAKGTPDATPSKPATRAAMPTDKVEQHINQLHAELHITSAQQPQWDQFAEVMRDNARSMEQAMQQRGSSLTTMTALDNMQSYSQIAQQHAQNMQKLTTAFQAVYDSMSEAQKKNADTIFRAKAETHHKKG